MILFFVFFAFMAAVLFALCMARQRLERQKERPGASGLLSLCKTLFYVGALAIVAYPVLFLPSLPRAISITGGAVVYVFFLLLMHFNAARRQEREARRNTMLTLLRQHVKARTIEKQVKEWNENYGTP